MLFHQPQRPPLGIYLHIPFCRQRCAYCDFYSTTGEEDKIPEYQQALLRHLRETAPLCQGYEVDTVYFGGGTPSLYPAELLVQLLREIRKDFHLSRQAEVTLEANPESVEPGMLKRLRRGGFNRISLGMQSARGEELASIGRIHTAQQTDEAVRAARRAGFQNLSLDLIYGLPGQDLERWRESVDHALSLDPDHLSCYGLKVEPGTPLERRVAAGEVLPDDDAQAELYLWTVEQLERSGLGQYEISNFAKPGCASRHNLKYWTLQPYLGFGPGAHSDFGERRFSFVRDLGAYLGAMRTGAPLVEEESLIPTRERGSEYLMLGLRTAQGVEEQVYRNRYFMDFTPLRKRLEEYEAQGWAQRTPGGWRLTPQGFLLSNPLIGDLLERQTPASFTDLLPGSQTQDRQERGSEG